MQPRTIIDPMAGSGERRNDDRVDCTWAPLCCRRRHSHIRGQVNGPNLIWHVTLAVRLTYNKVTSVQASCYSLMIGDGKCTIRTSSHGHSDGLLLWTVCKDLRKGRHNLLRRMRRRQCPTHWRHKVSQTDESSESISLGSQCRCDPSNPVTMISVTSSGVLSPEYTRTPIIPAAWHKLQTKILIKKAYIWLLESNG